MPAPFDFSQILLAQILDARHEAGYITHDCAHCSSIIVTRLSFRRMAFFSRLLANLFLKQIS